MKLIERLISDFKTLAESGKSKTLALDILCEKNKELNTNFIRSIIRGHLDGWRY